jgi:3-hydroxy acid dehydrogenase / malonic semialdehyde reductase
MSARLLAGRVAVVSGASSGIGEATALAIARQGAKVVLGARRKTRLESVAERIRAEGAQAEALVLDVADEQSCQAFSAAVHQRYGAIDVLINNAGLARGLGPVATGDERDWREMIEANVMGLMRITRLFLPSMIERKRGDIVHVGSIAGVEPYANGAAYCASKAAVEAFVQALRFELLGTNIRQLVIEPGMVETEFSVVRFHGDQKRADAVYQGVTALSGADVADCILFAITRPAHVCVQKLLVTPTAQAAATTVHREKAG